MYKYHLRPAFGSEKLLIEFFYGAEKNNFLSDFFNTIEELKPKVVDVFDLWMNDEVEINVNSEIGDFIISKDIWGFAFIMAENNQKCIYQINSILENTDKFEKIEFNFEDYKN